VRIGIVGAGAIGSNVGGALIRAGYDVTLIDQWPAHVEAMKTRGLRLSGTGGDYVVAVRALHLCEAQAIGDSFDAIFLAVKSYDTDWAAMFAVRFLRKPDGVIVSFQNGINDPRVAAIAGPHRTLGCVVDFGAGLDEPGHAMRTDPIQEGRVNLKIGELDGRRTERVRRLAEIVNHVARTEVTANLLGERWSKLGSNAMANAISGLSGYRARELRAVPLVRRLEIHIAAEVVLVARAGGVEITPILGIAPQRYVDAAEGRGFAELDAELARPGYAGDLHPPSLLQDVLRGRRTEVEELNGYVAAEGRRLGVPTPFNEAVVREVARHGVARLKPDPAHLEPLALLLPD
jgi:2-dehydropantoate 2-reductase